MRTIIKKLFSLFKRNRTLSHLQLQAMTYHERIAILEDEIAYLCKIGASRVQTERCKWLQREIAGSQVERNWQDAQEPAGLQKLRRMVV